MIARPEHYASTYEGDHHRLDYWTVCPNCPSRKDCKHNCGTPGWMKLYRRQRDGDEPREGAPEGWHELWVQSGVITMGSVKRAVNEAFEAKQMRMDL